MAATPGSRDAGFGLSCCNRRGLQFLLFAIDNGEYKSYTITPEEFGLSSCRKEDLEGGTPEENAAITLAVLNGEKGPKRNAVLLNAGAALYIGGKAGSIREGISLAAELIDSGRALAMLEAFKQESKTA